MIPPEIIAEVVEKFHLEKNQTFEHHMVEGSKCTISGLYVDCYSLMIPRTFEVGDDSYRLFMHLTSRELGGQIIKYIKDLEILLI